MDRIFTSGWRSAVVAVAAGGPAVLAAALNDDTALIFCGIATGSFFAIWGVWTYGSGLMLRTMQERLRISDLLVDELRASKLEVEMELARQRVQFAQLEEESSDEHRIPRGDRPS